MKETFPFIWHVLVSGFKNKHFSTLLKTYPESVSTTTEKNSLPIHL